MPKTDVEHGSTKPIHALVNSAAVDETIDWQAWEEQREEVRAILLSGSFERVATDIASSVGDRAGDDQVENN